MERQRATAHVKLSGGLLVRRRSSQIFTTKLRHRLGIWVVSWNKRATLLHNAKTEPASQDEVYTLMRQG